jgi:hypothetical protein
MPKGLHLVNAEGASTEAYHICVVTNSYNLNYQKKMMLYISTFLFALPSVLSTDDRYRPFRIPYNELISEKANDSFLTALQTVGMVSITNIPLFDKRFLNALPTCLEEGGVGSEFYFDDGSKRATLATRSVASISEPLKIPSSPACKEVEIESLAFRKTVSSVTTALTKYLATALGINDEPLLFDSYENPYTLTTIVNQGEQLEHFHCYSKEVESSNEETLEWHIDQGLMLSFTPGLVDGEPTRDFFIQQMNGETSLVEFSEVDDLVFFFGDGVDQYLNNYLVSKDISKLRSLPHALKLRLPKGKHRVWYGRMVLAPSVAIHPLHGLSYGSIRDSMMNDAQNLGLGCSTSLASRILADTNCTAESLYCWHRCMVVKDYNISEQICEERGLDLACINGEGYLWPGIHNPSFKPGCVNLTTATYWIVPNTTKVPTASPTSKLTEAPVISTASPATETPVAVAPTNKPTKKPSKFPTKKPSKSPTKKPTKKRPTKAPTKKKVV